jgi:hypothetical protein
MHCSVTRREARETMAIRFFLENVLKEEQRGDLRTDSPWHMDEKLFLMTLMPQTFAHPTAFSTSK